jgi:hypothetical protein
MHHTYFLSLTQFHPQSLCYSKPINSVASLMPSSFLFAGGGGGVAAALKSKYGR